MITIINNINEIKRMGEYYIQEGDKQLRIDCKVELVRIYDITAGVVYRKVVKDWDSTPSFREVARKVTNCRELVEYLAFQSDFEFREMDRNEIFNPFFKELEGELKIKSKTGRFTKAQVKKILKHKDTVIVRDAVYTDDYAYDAQYNFQNGVAIDNLTMLEEVETYFDGSTTFRGGEFKIYTYGNSNVTLIKNKNIKVVA